MSRIPDRNHQFVFVALGAPPKDGTDAWADATFVKAVVRMSRVSPSGRRLGSRALGLGIDAVLVALKAIIRAPRGPYLAANPWVGVALRAMGRRHVAVTGIYASPGSRSFRVLRTFLRNSAVITTVSIEADAWRKAGGTATAVLYGNTFHYPLHKQQLAESSVTIFVGGSSDRDPVALAKLEDAVRESRLAAHLVIVADEPASSWANDRSETRHTGRVDSEEFGRLLSESDVAYLPLQDSQRAAGHMVTVGALEVGIPVVTSPTAGMLGYVNAEEVIESSLQGTELLGFLLSEARRGQERTLQIRAHWKSVFSLNAYIERVGEALDTLVSRSRDQDL